MRLRRRLVATMIDPGGPGTGRPGHHHPHLAALLPLRTGRRPAHHGQPSDRPPSSTGPTDRGFTVTPAAISTHVGPDIYVELIDSDGTHRWSPPVATPRSSADPAPALPSPLPPAPVTDDGPGPDQRPRLPPELGLGQRAASAAGTDPQYRLQAVLAARADPDRGHQSLTTVNATLDFPPDHRVGRLARPAGRPAHPDDTARSVRASVPSRTWPRRPTPSPPVT